MLNKFKFLSIAVPLWDEREIMMRAMEFTKFAFLHKGEQPNNVY